MSVPLRGKKRSEAPLITFTLCVPAAVGVVALATVFELASLASGYGGNVLRPNLLLALLGGSSFLLAVIGMLASMAHLAKPLRAPFSLRHLQSSWLSREIAAVGLFWVCIVVWLVGSLLGSAICALVGLLCSAVSGVALLFVIARAYKVSTRPAWLGSECAMELGASTCGSGAALFLLCIAACMAWAAHAGIIFGEWAGAGGNPVLVVGIVLSCMFMIASMALGPYAHKSRYRRLLSLREISDERIALTLENYERLQPVVRLAWRIELAGLVSGTIGSCLLLGALFVGDGMGGLMIGAIAFFLIATILEFVAHGLQRWLFYEIPVPVRYVAALRK